MQAPELPSAPEPAPAPAAEPAPAPVAAPATPPPPPPAPQAEAVRIDPKEYLQSADLQMVETRAGSAAAPAPEEETLKLGRPRRERPRQAAEESLVQVETRK